jgi:hypothetical protein
MTDALREGGLYQDELGQWKDANGNPAKPPTKSEQTASSKQQDQAERDFQADAERLGEQDAALTWTTGTTGEVVKPEPQATGAADQPVTSLAPADSGPDAQPPTPEESREFAPDAPTKKGRK